MEKKHKINEFCILKKHVCVKYLLYSLVEGD